MKVVSKTLFRDQVADPPPGQLRLTDSRRPVRVVFRAAAVGLLPDAPDEVTIRPRRRAS